MKDILNPVQQRALVMAYLRLWHYNDDLSKFNLLEAMAELDNMIIKDPECAFLPSFIANHSAFSFLNIGNGKAGHGKKD